MKRIEKQKKRIIPLLLGSLLLLLQMIPTVSALDDDAYDGYAADTLTIEVGYFGGPYYEKRVFTNEELWAMPLVREDYTFIDNMPSVVIDHVVGVRLDDLMREAGIDVNSIETFYFWTRDKTTDYYTSYSKTELLDTTRYCYYSLPENFDSETGVGGEGADAIASPVPTVMALSDDWNRCIKGAEFGSDYLDLNTATRFRLIFGQVDTSTRTAQRSAKWVHKIVVSLGGAPTITVDTADLEMEVGSVRRVEAQIHAADSAISSAASIEWSSSDESVATVDQDGSVTVVGEGSAIITVSGGGASASFTVNGTGKKEEEESPSEPEPEEPGEDQPVETFTEVQEEPQATETREDTAPKASGTRQSSSGNGQETVGSKNGRTPTVTASRDSSKLTRQASEKETRTEPEQKPTKVQGVTLDGSGDNLFPSDGTATDTVTSAEDETGGVQNWRIYEMSETAQELPEIEMDNPLLGVTGAASGIVLISGGVTEYILYRRRF